MLDFKLDLILYLLKLRVSNPMFFSLKHQPSDCQRSQGRAVIVDLQLVVRFKCRYEKNRCADVNEEVISLSTSFIMLITLHFCYVFMLICCSLYRHCFPLLRCSASHAHILSVSPQVSSLPSSFVAHKNPRQTISVQH